MNYGKKLLSLPLTLLLGTSLIFLASSFYFLTSNIKAQSSSNYDVTVSPVFFDLSANPGSSVSDKIRIRNNTSSSLPIKVEVKRLTGDENGDLTLKDENSDNSLSWIKFNNTTFVAKPLEWSNVPFTIEVPKEAAYGYYYAITFTQDDKSPLAKTGAKITGSAAVPILLNVRKEGAKFQGRVIEFKSDSGYYEYPPVKLLTRFENTGNIHLRPRGNIFIKDWLGRQVAILDINTTQGAVLPNIKKSFESQWDDSFITIEPKIEDGQVKLDKNGKQETKLKIRFDKILDLRIGKYTATALLVISTNTKDIPFQVETSFFIFPWKVVIAVILFVIFAGIGFFNTIKNFVRRIIRIFRRG